MVEKVVYCAYPDKHGENHHKHIKDMQICALAVEYCMKLVEAGEIDEFGCELCTIEWVCTDPMEFCMNPVDTPQWHTQCTRPVKFWVGYIEAMLNDPEMYKNMGNSEFYIELVKSMLEYATTHNLTIKLVQNK